MVFSKKIIYPVFLSLLFASCASNNFDFTPINADIEKGNYNAAILQLEESQSDIYGKHDEVISYLDFGVLNHYAKNPKESNQYFSDAEKLIDEYKARSISQTISSFLTNDLAMDYAGDDYEDIYTNIFMSLNYLSQGNLEDAMVEVRRFDNKIKLLKEKYEKEVKEVNSNAKEDEVQIEKVSIQFSNSALARYLSMLMYRANGDISNANVDLKFLKNAFYTQKDLYNFQIPSTVEEEIAVKKNDARVNIISFYGKAPTKHEEATRVYYPYAGIWYKLALPKMTEQGSNVTTIIAEFESTSTGEKLSTLLEKIESIENIALDTFQQKYSIIKAKSLARSITKAVANTTLDVVADQLSDDNNPLGLVFGLIGVATKAYTEVTEIADTRTSRFFPAYAATTGITLNPDEYNVTLKFFKGSNLLYSETKPLTVKAGKLNLLEINYLN